MGLMEVLTGWKYIGTAQRLNVNIDPKIIKIINSKISKKNSYFLKNWLKENKDRAPLGRTSRGYKVTPNIPPCTIHVNGKTFIYRAKAHSARYIDNHGHGGYVSNPSIKIWRKIK